MLWVLATLALLLALSWLGRRLLGVRRSTTAPRSSNTPPGSEPLQESEEARPIGDELDLHGVPPREVSSLVDAFIDAACTRNARFVRIVHGRGIGVLRRLVRARLARHPRVVAFGDAPPPSGWGATVAELSTLTEVERTRTSD